LKGPEMAKVKIIDSYSLECLNNDILSEIEDANSQITSYEKELNAERAHRQDEKTIKRVMDDKKIWDTKKIILHRCLCDIQSYTKEIEI